MAALKGPIVFPSPKHTPLKKTTVHLQGGFWNCRPRFNGITVSSGFFNKSCPGSNWSLCSSLNSPGDSGSRAGNYGKSNEDYVNCSVIEAVNVTGGPHGLMIEMLDGSNMRCVFNSRDNLALRETGPCPVIVLKMEDGSGLLFAIDTVEKQNAMLMDVVRDVKTVETTAYGLLKDMIDTLGYEVRLIRITERNQVLVARVYLSQVGNEKHEKIVDIRPPDAIIIALRCKAQIQVNKLMAYNEGMRVLDVIPGQHRPIFNSLFEYIDWVQSQSNYEEEFGLLKNMMIAASEERYKDAARYRDMLYELRQKQKK